jgi:hypothetical protein
VGKVTEEFGCFQIEASEMHRMPYLEDPRYGANRFPVDRST